MDIAFPLILLLGVVIGAGWLLVQARHAVVEAARGRAEDARLHAEREARLREQIGRLQGATASEDQLRDAFHSLSQEVLSTQTQQLLHLAEARYGALQQTTDTVLAGHGKAVDDGLRALSQRLGALEKERAESTAALRTMVEELGRANRATQEEAARLSAALRDNRVRGAWGEVQLRRVLELAGLDRHADFVEQVSVGDLSHRGRPDVVVALPFGRSVVIDAKAPLDRYLDAANCADPATQQRLLAEHAKAVGNHVNALASRDYVAKVDGAVDMVLLFLPGDAFLAAALDADPGLFESSAKKGVHLVTPSSILPVLRGIALGWREHRAEQAAAEIHALGVELHERIAVFAEHFATVGRHLDRTVEAFNASVGSLDSRVLATARKLEEHGAGSGREVLEAPEIDANSRPIRMLALVPEEQQQRDRPLGRGGPMVSGE